MKIARRILSMLNDDALMGDIEEEYIKRQRELGQAAAFRWYCREVMMAVLHSLANRKLTMKQPLTFTLALGVGGGVLLAASLSVMKGPAILVIYALIPVFYAFYFRVVRIDGFGRRFAVGVASFMIATIIMYVVLNFMLGLGRISWWGHTWRLGMMLGIGSGLAASIAQIMTPAIASTGRSSKQQALAFSLALGAFGGAALWVSLMGRTGWVSALAVCALILLIAAWHLSRVRVAGFWSRYVITMSSYIMAMAVPLVIASMNHGVHWRWIAKPLTIGLLAGCLLSFLVARWTAPEPEPAAH